MFINFSNWVSQKLREKKNITQDCTENEKFWCWFSEWIERENFPPIHFSSLSPPLFRLLHYGKCEIVFLTSLRDWKFFSLFIGIKAPQDMRVIFLYAIKLWDWIQPVHKSRKKSCFFLFAIYEMSTQKKSFQPTCNLFASMKWKRAEMQICRLQKWSPSAGDVVRVSNRKFE